MTLTIPVSSNDMYMLENIFLPNNPIGVGQLSRFLGIEIDNSWRERPVRVEDIYNPSEHWTFDFTRCELTSSRYPNSTFKWTNRPMGNRLPPSQEEAMKILLESAGIRFATMLLNLRGEKGSDRYINAETLETVHKNEKTCKRYQFYNNGLALRK